ATELPGVRPPRSDALRTGAAATRSPPTKRPHGWSVRLVPAPTLPGVERIQRVGVVGLGTMGAGIAQLAIEAGLDTIGLEADRGRAEAARERIGHFLGRKVEKGQLEGAARDDALARLCLVSDTVELAGRELVIQAVFED